MKFNITKKVVDEASEYMVQQVKYELQAKRPRTNIRATWKKVGSDWQPTSVRKTKSSRNYVASGNLVNSVQPISNTGLEFGVTFAWYGQAIINGRQPWGKWKGDKGIPPNVLNKWISQRNIKPRDTKGKFVGNKAKSAMSFMMNRKIKYFGIEPFDFVTMPRKVTMNKFLPQIKEAVKQDIINNKFL
jgi:hypothetical protein